MKQKSTEITGYQHQELCVVLKGYKYDDTWRNLLLFMKANILEKCYLTFSLVQSPGHALTTSNADLPAGIEK
jgi:hypothetical protein